MKQNLSGYFILMAFKAHSCIQIPITTMSPPAFLAMLSSWRRRSYRRPGTHWVNGDSVIGGVNHMCMEVRIEVEMKQKYYMAFPWQLQDR
jgi:hypothetical protein